jgi:translation initiation factor 2B subunit (eIF-2B alpha/beta/delta family)
MMLLVNNIQNTINFSQKNITLWLKTITYENKHTKQKPNPRAIEIQKVLQNVKKYCKITDDSSDEQLLEYISKNTPITTLETIIYGSKQREIDSF